MDELDDLETTVALSTNFLQICDPEVLPFRRVWCLFEVVAWIHATTKPISLRVGRLDSSDAHTFCAVAPDDFHEIIRSVRMEDAEATIQADIDLIFNTIRSRIPGGFETVNEKVRRAVIHHATELHMDFASDYDERTQKVGMAGLRQMYKEADSGNYNFWRPKDKVKFGNMATDDDKKQMKEEETARLQAREE